MKYFGNPEEVGWGHPQYHAGTPSLHLLQPRLWLTVCVAVPDVMSKQLLQQSDMWMLAQTAYHMWAGKEPGQNPEILPAGSTHCYTHCCAL